MDGLRWRRDINSEELEILRTVYEANEETVLTICERHRISKTRLRNLVIAHGWRPRSPRRIDPRDIIGRLFRLLDAQITEMEQNMTKASAGEAAVLSRLVATLDKLIGMKNAETAARPKARRTKEISDIKARLIERIEQLKRG